MRSLRHFLAPRWHIGAYNSAQLISGNPDVRHAPFDEGCQSGGPARRVRHEFRSIADFVRQWVRGQRAVPVRELGNIPNKQQDIRRSVLSEQFTLQTEEFFAASGAARNVQPFIEDGVAKSREAYLKLNSAAKDSLRAFDDAMSCAYAGARTISEKVLLNTEANAEAAFDAAQLISRAKTFPEVVSLQSSFLQKQVADASTQTKEYYELSTKVAQQMFEAMSSAFTNREG